MSGVPAPIAVLRDGALVVRRRRPGRARTVSSRRTSSTDAGPSIVGADASGTVVWDSGDHADRRRRASSSTAPATSPCVAGCWEPLAPRARSSATGSEVGGLDADTGEVLWRLEGDRGVGVVADGYAIVTVRRRLRTQSLMIDTDTGEAVPGQEWDEPGPVLHRLLRRPVQHREPLRRGGRHRSTTASCRSSCPSSRAASPPPSGPDELARQSELTDCSAPLADRSASRCRGTLIVRLPDAPRREAVRDRRHRRKRGDTDGTVRRRRTAAAKAWPTTGRASSPPTKPHRSISTASSRADPAVRGMTAARPGRVLVLGCGSVAQCTIPLLLRDLGDRPVAADRRRLRRQSRPHRRRARRRASPTRSTASPRTTSTSSSSPDVGRRRPAARPRLEHRQPDDPAVVPRPRRPLPQHERRAVGPVPRPRDDAPARPHAVRAPHGPAPAAAGRGPTTRARPRSSSTAPTRASSATSPSRR